MDPTAAARPPRSRWRPALASLAALAGALGFVGLLRSPSLALAIPIGLLVAAAGLVWRESLPSQLLVRAVLWSNLLLGVLLSVDGNGHEQTLGGLLALSTGAGLLVLGRSGLAAPSPVFSPAAFRGSLILALVMALADAQPLALFGVFQLGKSNPAEAAPLLACAALMVVAIVGLARLRVWGLVLNLVANLLIAGLALGGALKVPQLLAWTLATTALIQLLLPLPMIVTIARGRPPAPIRHPRLRAALVPCVVVILMALSVATR